MQDLHSLGLTTEILVCQMPLGGQHTVDQTTGQIHKSGPPRMCGQHNIRATAGDNTGQNTKDTTSPRIEKILTSPGIEPGPPGWKAGTPPTMLRRRTINIY